MKKKIIKSILGTALGLFLSVSVVAGIANLQNNRLEVFAAWQNEEITESYFLGAEFTLPEAKLTVGNKTVDASVILIFPDGSATRTEKIVLNQVGTYLLKYSATVEGKPYGKDVMFNVRGDMITYKSESTKIGYQTCEYASDLAEEYLTVSLAQGDTITFSQFIDVSTITKDETLIDLFVAPATRGIADFDKLIYLFTDSANPDIYLKVRLSRYIKNSGAAFYLSGGNGQELKGYEAKPNKLHVNNEYGAAFSNITFDAQNSAKQPINVDAFKAIFRYDAGTRATYAINETGGLAMIMDQDSTLYYENLWTGFPSGKVSLSIWAENYNSANATFCITGVRGIDVSAYGKKFEESEPPVITVDSEYEKMPEAKLGGAYTVPNATAFDDYSGVCKVDVAVWYNYMSSNAILVNVEEGKFITNRRGYYSIVYTATDRYGNTANTVLTVHAGNEIQPITVTPLFTPQEKVVLGEWLTFSSDLEISGGSGNKTVSITLSNGAEVYKLKENGFRPEKAGEWTVTYTATDYVGNEGVYSYKFNTELPTQPLLVDAVVLPQLFISAQAYTIPAVYANDYRSGELNRGLCDVEVRDANGTKTYKSGETFSPTVNQSGDKVSLTFKFAGVSLKTIEIPTVLAWEEIDGTLRLQEQNYFYGEGFSAEATASGVHIAISEQDANWTFANALVARGLSVILKNDIEFTDNAGYEMTLIDAGDPENSIRMQVVKKGTVCLFSVYGTDLLLELHCDLNKDSVDMGFDGNSFVVNKTPIKALKTVNGKEFNGFVSAKVFVNIKSVNAVNGVAYRVVSINGNPFTAKTRDLVSPNVTIFGDYGGSYAINSKYTVNSAIASDVLSPNVNFTMSLKLPSGGFAKDINGKELRDVDPTVSYDILLSEYGQYTAVYTATEDKSFSLRPTKKEFLFGINAVDMEAPEITFNGDFQTAVKVGEILLIPDFTVSDNLSSAEEIIVAKFVYNPYGAIVELTNGNSVKVAHEGRYEIRIIVIDKIGNVKMIQTYVTVTK
ncbi:MAG: hypothetical protein IJA15_01425 [Clostridia bacterium]|nr:hypothetical protein [Clostridia bacterium]